MNQITLWKLTNAICSLSDSTHIRLRVPFGPGVEVNGRNGKRPTWEVRSMSIPEKLDAYFVGDNGKYAIIFSPYYSLNWDPNSEWQTDKSIELVEGVLPSSSVFPIFRGVKDVFMLFNDADLMHKFLPTQTVHVYVTRPYVQILWW